MQHCIITFVDHVWPICGPCMTYMWPICDPYVTHVWPICDLYVTYSGWWLSHAVHHDVTIYKRMSKNALRLFALIGKRTKRNGTACARQFHEKNRIWPICDSSFFTVIIPLYAWLCTWFLRKCLFLLSQVRFHESIARFIVCIMYRVTWLFPAQDS